MSRGDRSPEAEEERLRAALEKLQREKQFSESVVESLPGIFYLFSEEGRFLRWNRNVELLTGYSADEIAERLTALDFIVPEDRSAVADRIAEVFARGEASIEGRLRTKEGRGIPHFFTGKRVVIEGIPCVMGTGIDITDRKRAEALVEEKSRELERSNRELEQFAFAVSHDLKAPLRGILSLSAWLVRDQSARLDESGRTQLDLIASQARRLQRMIDGILEYSRAGRRTATRTETDAGAVLAEVLDGLSIPNGIEVHVEGAFPRLRLDPVQLAQVFQNLIDNAVKHLGRPEGTVTVRCRDQGGDWAFEVADDGVGIEPAHHERIFRLFQTLRPEDEPGASTGIGLALVKKIVEGSGGELGVESTPGAGTLFRFTVPKADPAAPTPGSC